MIKGTLLEPLAWWVFAGIAVTGVFAGIYLAVQQDYRQTLNDPQIQMAEDAAHKIYEGGVPADVVPRGELIDIRRSLAPWIAVYDINGTVLESSGQLDGAPPHLPNGLFNRFTGAGEFIPTRVTWEPEPGVRQALVIEPTTPGGGMYVVVGRNMREQENRVAQLGFNLFLAWGFTGVCLLIASFIGWFLLKPKK